jgi:hypothetical protein
MLLKSKTAATVISLIATSFLVISALISPPCETMEGIEETCCCCERSEPPILEYGRDSQECGCQISEASPQQDIVAVIFFSDDSKPNTSLMSGEVKAVDVGNNAVEDVIASDLLVSARGQPLYILHSSFLI